MSVKYIAAVLIIIATGVYMTLNRNVREVVIYPSVDQIYSEPVLDLFESETDIKVKAVYEINKTVTVIVQSIIACFLNSLMSRDG